MWQRIALFYLDVLFALANNTCNVLERVFGWRVFYLSEESILKALPDVVVQYLLEDDKLYANFKETIRVLRTINLTPVGRAAWMNQIKMSLENGLYFKQVWNASVQAGKVAPPVRKPLMMVNMTRTGSTLLHSLLSCDKRLYCQTTRQIMPTLFNSPCNLLGLLQTLRVVIRLRHIHELNIDLAEEVYAFSMQSFFHGELRFGTYGDDRMNDWDKGLDDSTHLYFSRNLRKLVEILKDKHSSDTTHTVVKYHMRRAHLPSLSVAFPDAIFINTVRDPVASVASSCSLSNTSSGGSCKVHDLDTKIGQITLRTLSKAANAFVKFRTSNQRHHTFVDVMYKDLMTDPIEAVRKIYRVIDIDLSPEVECKMRDYLEKNKQHKHGRHSYTLAQYGLDKQSVVNEFGPYMEFYNLSSDYNNN